MFNFRSYFNLVNNFKKNNLNLETVKHQINTEKTFFESINTLDTNYFKMVEKELERNKLHIYDNMIIDENIYDSILNYEDYIEKLLSGEEISYDVIIENLTKFTIDTEISMILIKVENNIIQNYQTNISYSGDTKPIEPIKYMFWEKIEDFKVGKVKIDNYYNITKDHTDKYSLKDEIVKQLNETKNIINTYTQLVLDNKTKYITSIEQDDIKIITDIISNFKYEDIPEFILPSQPQGTIIGGSLELQRQNYKIRKSLIIQQQLVEILSKIKTHFENYFVAFYNIFMYSLFICNDNITRSYSFFVFNKLSKNLISKFYNSVMSIDKLNKKNYSIVLKVIHNFLIENTAGSNILISRNISFVLLIDKLNILLRQHNEKYVINKEIKINNLDTDEIFLAGNRSLDNFIIFYDTNNLTFSSVQEQILFLGKLMFYFLVSNLYLITNIWITGHGDIVIWQLKDLMFTNLNTQNSVYKKMLTGEYEVVVNERHSYKFINHNNFSSTDTTRKKYLILKF